MINAKNITVSYSNHVVLNDISFNIQENDKISLIGKNGSGKSTLMKTIAGLVDLDDGKINTQTNKVIGYLTQKVIENKNISAIEYIEKFDHVSQKDLLNKRYIIEQFLSQLDINKDDKLSKLSGGQLRKVEIAKILSLEPDILLLDEPTNHLDIATIEWLESYIRKFEGIIVCVSHDRRFLSNITNKMYFMHRGELLVSNKGYKFFDEWYISILENEEKELDKLNQKLKEEKKWMLRGVTARRKRNMGRVRELNKLKDKVNDTQNQYKKKSINFDFEHKELKSKFILELIDINKKFGNKNIINNFSARILKNDRIGIVGKNGSGKTTLLNIILNKESVDNGQVIRPLNIEKFLNNVAYFDQNRKVKDESISVKEFLCPDGREYININGRDKHVMAYLKDFMFDSDDTKMAIAHLSGGQFCRLMLAKTMIIDSNILILDEPTNDLDIETLDVLQDIIDNYKGTVFLVSHDRDFLDNTVNKLFVFEGEGEVSYHIGNYSDYMLNYNNKKNNDNKKNNISTNIKGNKDIKREKKLSYKDKLRLEKIDLEMNVIQQDILNIENQLNEEGLFENNPDLFNSLAIKLENKKKLLSELEDEWFLLEEKKLEIEIENDSNN